MGEERVRSAVSDFSKNGILVCSYMSTFINTAISPEICASRFVVCDFPRLTRWHLCHVVCRYCIISSLCQGVSESPSCWNKQLRVCKHQGISTAGGRTGAGVCSKLVRPSKRLSRTPP